MKKMKKLTSLLLTLVMMLSLSVTAFAASSCSITIKDAVKDETYNAYKIFDVTVATTSTTTGDTTTTTGTAYSYTITNTQTVDGNSTTNSNPWFETIQNFKVKNNGADTAVFTLTPSAGDATKWVVSVNSGFGEKSGEISYVKELAKALNDAYLAMETKPFVDGTGTGTESDGTVSATITNLDPGYYFVDSSLGAVCALGTIAGVDNDATIYEKNSAPTIDKQVFNPSSDKVYENAYTLNDDSTDGNGAWKDNDGNTDPATVDVCQTVYYKLVVNTGTDTYTDTETGVDADYVIEDTLPAGFTYNANSIKIVDEVNKDVTDSTKAADWTIDDYSIDTTTVGKVVITLKSTGKLGGLEENKNITITYAATMTNSGVKFGVNGQNISDGTSAANTNTAKLSYQKRTIEGTETAVVRSTDDATVYTYQIGGTYTPDGETNPKPIIQKVDGTNINNPTPLAGVKFILSKDVNGTTYYATVSNKTTNTAGSYYLTGWTNEKNKAVAIVTGENGGIEVLGLDAGTYVLTEVETLDGYNLLDGTITVTIVENGTVKYKYNGNDGTTTTDTTNGDETITIVNKTGTELPSTGGMGTTIFYIIGGILVIVAAILLITRRRMNASK